MLLRLTQTKIKNKTKTFALTFTDSGLCVIGRYSKCGWTYYESLIHQVDIFILRIEYRIATIEIWLHRNERFAYQEQNKRLIKKAGNSSGPIIYKVLQYRYCCIKSELNKKYGACIVNRYARKGEYTESHKMLKHIYMIRAI